MNNVFDHENIIQIRDGKVRMEDRGSGVYTLYDAKAHKLYTVDTKEEHYIQSTPETIRLRTQELVMLQEQFKRQLQDQLASLPLEHRALAEKRLAQAEQMLKTALPKFELEHTDQQEQVNGIPCVVLRFKIGSQLIQELCRANETVIEPDDLKSLANLYQFLDELAQEVAKIQQLPPPSQPVALIYNAGLALRLTTLAQHSTSELTQLSQEPLSEKIFTIPSHYKTFDPMKTASQLPPLSH